MAGFFEIGETKVRPGVYKRYENAGGASTAGAQNGVCAALFKADWGPLGEVVELDPSMNAADVFGSAEGVSIIDEMFLGGASKVLAVRAGSEGTKGSFALKAEGSDAADALKLEANYPGAKAFSLTIRDSVADETKRECIIYDGTKVYERFPFAKGANEAASLAEAVKASKNWTASAVSESAVLADVTQQEITKGTDPTVDNAAYAEAGAALEPFSWNVIAADTNEAGIHAVLHAFITRVYSTGKLVMGVVGGSAAMELDERMTAAASYNDEKMIYVLNSWKDASGTLYDGYRAAARIAGMVAAVPANESLTHTVVTGAVKLAEPLTGSQINKALTIGALCFTASAQGQIWIESGINTLVTPSGSQDEGWKKIRRVKTRFELMNRITNTIDQLIGKVNNDSGGRAAIINAGQSVIDQMIGERKLQQGSSFTQDPVNPPNGDSAWFVIAVDDIDSVEKVYLDFRFRFSPEA